MPGDVKLPDNARAEIRQTSLLGEKFVQLSEPRDPGTGKLSNNDVIGLDRTGRNPEVEEVLGALSLLLNGGGVGQLKTIVSELNNAFEGREPEVALGADPDPHLHGPARREQGVHRRRASRTPTAWRVEIRKQDGAIKSALDDIPDALRSVDRQRADLVKLLEALTRLSGVGVRVIRASKESTINSLRHLGPVLEGFAKAGDELPQVLPGVPDLPVRRRGRRSRPAGRPQPAHGRLHQPLGQPRHQSDVTCRRCPSCPRSRCRRDLRTRSRRAQTRQAAPGDRPACRD